MLERPAFLLTSLAPLARSPAALSAFVLGLACSSADSLPIIAGQSGAGGGTGSPNGGSMNGGSTNGTSGSSMGGSSGAIGTTMGGATMGGATMGGATMGGATMGGATMGGATKGGSLGTSGGASSGGAKATGGALGAGTTGMTGGSSGSGGSGGAVTGTFATVSAYLSGYCATSTACHGSGASRVVLRGTTLYDTLTSKTVSKCSSKVLVVKNDPAASALYGVLTGGCGKFFMPPACTSAPCGTADNIKLVETWIKSGAPNN